MASLSLKVKMNELLGAIIVASSIEEVNKTIKSKGFNDADDLKAAIRHLDIEIAKAKDDNRQYDEMLKLRNEYVDLYNQYVVAYEKEREKTRKNNIVFLIFFLTIIVAGLVALFVFLFNL